MEKRKGFIPTTPEEVLKRIMNDLTKIRKRSKEEFEFKEWMKKNT